MSCENYCTCLDWRAGFTELQNRLTVGLTLKTINQFVMQLKAYSYLNFMSFFPVNKKTIICLTHIYSINILGVKPSSG